MARTIAIATALLLFTATTAQAADDLKDRVAKAVAAGQKYLKAARAAGNDGELFGRDGINADAGLAMLGGNGSGSSWLTGLALIESGLNEKDPMVATIARAARQSPFNTRSTYEISLMIMFLDRLRAREDEGRTLPAEQRRVLGRWLLALLQRLHSGLIGTDDVRSAELMERMLFLQRDLERNISPQLVIEGLSLNNRA